MQGLKEILEEKGKLVATLHQGRMGGFTKKKGNEITPPKLEREEVSQPLVPGFVCVIRYLERFVRVTVRWERLNRFVRSQNRR